MDSDWLARTRRTRFMVYGLVAVVAAVSFGLQGHWRSAAIALALGLAPLGALWWFLGSIKRTPTLDIGPSLRKVGANASTPRQTTEEDSRQ